MGNPASIDSLVRNKLRRWPQRPPGLPDGGADGGAAWLKARPGHMAGGDTPFLKLPGASRLRTLPDGLWLQFGGTGRDRYVDAFAIEICGTYPNLMDKRSRFAPSMHSLLAVCPQRWLRDEVSPEDRVPRWQRAQLEAPVPAEPLVLPVRDIRVMYALRPRQFTDFVASQIPHAHEFFVPVTALLGPDGWRDNGLRAFIARAAARANCWDAATALLQPEAGPAFAP